MKLPYVLVFSLFAAAAMAGTISIGDVTAELGPGFFIDDASPGGSDFSSGNANFTRDFSGMAVGTKGSDLIITGVGWASRISGTTATQATVTITYLGGDGLAGGGDDVPMGSRTDALVFSGAGEYVWPFDSPMVASIDGSNSVFLVNIKTDGTGVITYKSNTAVKLSVAGSSVALETPNLARYRNVIASSNQSFARYATDGVVGSDFKWTMGAGASLPQDLDIAFPGPVEIGSYHLYTGINNGNLAKAWRLQYRLNGSAWADVPGSAVSANGASDRAVVFPPLTVDQLRLRITANEGDGRPRIREWAVFPPNGGTGYPLGTGVALNMAQGGLTTAGANATGQFPRLASDGYLGTRWVSGPAGPHALEVTLRDEIEIGSAHLYSGDGTPGSAIPAFELEYSNDGGATWSPVPGGSIAGNTNAARIVAFSSAVAADMVRLTTTNAGPVSIREFAVFPDNNAGGYPINTGVNLGGPPPLRYETYGDSFYRIRAAGSDQVLKAVAAGTTLAAPSKLDGAQVYQVLLNVGTDTYRIFNRESRKCLAVKAASLLAGTEIIEETYGAFPSQQWRLVGAGGGSVYIENVFSGLRMDVAGDAVPTVVQMPRNAVATQKWNIDLLRRYPKKGAAGAAAQAGDMGASWYYGLTANDVAALNTNVVDFNPMQWGNFNWDPDNYNASGQLPLTVRFPDWLSRGHPLVFLGFNEPDATEQSNIAVDKAIELWPQLMASGLPLASPVAKNWNTTWMSGWMGKAESRGYRIDYLAMHTYPGPDAASVAASIAAFSAAYGGRPVMLTEFGFVDWGDNQNWTENLLYNQMIELLWRMETTADCKRYSLFGFTESDSSPQPADPTGRANRSNWKYANGSFTPLGEAYMAWDGDTTPNGDQPYILHNRSFDMRVRNDGTATVGAVNIRTGDASSQVVFESIGNGYYYLVSSIDGKRLRKTGADSVAWAAPNTTSADAQWSWSLVEAGWHLVSNRTGGNLRYSDAAGVHMGTATGSYYQWFFVPPMNPADTIDPAPPTGLSATPSHRQVGLQWTESISGDTVAYAVRRSTIPGGPYQVAASGIVAARYTDTGLVNGTNYYYVVDTLDRFGNTGTSVEISATPAAPAPDTYANWALGAFDGAPEGTDTAESGNPDGDGYVNFAEYLFLLDPLVGDAMAMGIDADAGGGISITFRINRLATDLSWGLQSTSGLAAPAGWSPTGFSIQSQSNFGDRVEYVVQPDAPLPAQAFYRIDATKN